MSAKHKALEKQEKNEAARAARAAEEAEKAAAAQWSVGAKDSARIRQEEEKEAERRRKAAEKAALEAAEDAELSGVARKVKTKKKGKDDFDVLKAALAQQPKTKAQREAEAKKAADAERRQKEEEARVAREARRLAEEEEIRKAAARGIVIGHSDALMVPINNRLEEDDFVEASGLDAALDTISIAVSGPGGKVDEHPERRQKAMYNAYYEAQLPILKAEHPGLKLSQYKERIFDMWKTAPENPRNQSRQASSAAAAVEDSS